MGNNDELVTRSRFAGFIATLLGMLYGLTGCTGNDGGVGSATGRATSAVVVATTITSGEQPSTYVMALPDVPDARLDTDNALEFGGWSSVRAWKQYVFVYEPESATLRRYVVSEDFRLAQDGPTLSFTVAGAAEGLDLNLYDDDTAYAAPYSPGQVTIVEWNPTRMEISREIGADLPSPTVPSFLDSNGFVGQFSGSETWHVYGNDSDALTFNDQAMLGFLDPGASTLGVISHAGCAPNIKGYVLDGDLYLVGAGTNAENYANFNPAHAVRAPNCVLRVKAGERRFDPDYFINLTELTGSKAVQNTKIFDAEHVIVEFWDPADPLPALPDDYWGASSFKSLSLNLRTGESAPIDDLFPKGTQGSYADLVMDGTPYFTIVAADFNDTTVKTLQSGALTENFSTPGYLHLIARVE